MNKAKNKTKPQRNASDNLCKRLAEEHPIQFARWLFGVSGKVKVEKTELDREPVRADAVIFSRADSEILHAEFQTTMKSAVPVPLRLLDYYVGLKRRHPQRRIRQVLVVLKPTAEAIPDRYEDERTFATLCRAEAGEPLLVAVAEKINEIKSPAHRREALNWSRMLAGLRYDKNLIGKILQESDMEESVIYQDILEKGERKVLRRLLEQRFGKLSKVIQQNLERLVTDQLEALADALRDFKTKDDLTRWFSKYAPAPGKRS
jgi:predicted transposase YdaD